MNKKEILSVISVGDVIKKTDVRKVMRCYDFQEWEVKELLSLQNNTIKSINEFRWEYVRGTLMINNDIFADMGVLVRDLIDDIKMGYHRVSNDVIYADINNKESVTLELDNIKPMNFEYKPLVDYRTNRITHIEISYEKGKIGLREKKREIKELLNYLDLI